MNFSQTEILRYQRHFALPDVGIEGQEKLKSARVLCVGLGGIGSPVSLYLAAAGIGHLGIIDDDLIELSNLQRQILYQNNQVGKSKAACAYKRLSDFNSDIKITSHRERLTDSNAEMIIQAYDLIIDGSDNLKTRYLINDSCVTLNKSFISASIFQYQGNLGLFNFNENGCYRCLFPNPPPTQSIPTCQDTGVFGAIVGVIGTMAATLAINLITQTGKESLSKFHFFNGQSFTLKRFTMHQSSLCLCSKRDGQTNISAFTRPGKKDSPFRHIHAKELARLMTSKKAHQLIDIREAWERDICHIAGDTHFSLETIMNYPFKKNCIYILYCKSGQRSKTVVQTLMNTHSFSQIFSLKGGLIAWKENVELDMASY